MGRPTRPKKVLKRIDSILKRQVTFSKRRTSLIKKAEELSVLCDVDVAFVAFSPSGRPSHFPNTRLSEVLTHYINIPPEKRKYPIKHPQHFLRELAHIPDNDKVIFVNNQIEYVKRQTSDMKVQLEIIEFEIRCFELDPQMETSVDEYDRKAKFLEDTLKRILAKKEIILLRNRNTAMLVASNVQMGIVPYGGMGSSFSGVGMGELNHQLNANQISRPINSLPQNINDMDPWLHPERKRNNSSQELLNEECDNSFLQASSSNYPMYHQGNPSVQNISSMNQLVPHVSPTYQPIQQGIVDYSVERFLQNQQLGNVGNSSMRMVGSYTAQAPYQPPSTGAFGGHRLSNSITVYGCQANFFPSLSGQAAEPNALVCTQRASSSSYQPPSTGAFGSFGLSNSTANYGCQANLFPSLSGQAAEPNDLVCTQRASSSSYQLPSTGAFGSFGLSNPTANYGCHANSFPSLSGQAAEPNDLVSTQMASWSLYQPPSTGAFDSYGLSNSIANYGCQANLFPSLSGQAADPNDLVSTQRASSPLYQPPSTGAFGSYGVSNSITDYGSQENLFPSLTGQEAEPNNLVCTQRPSSSYQLLPTETFGNNGGSLDSNKDVTPIFDVEEFSWILDVPINNDQNFNVSEPFNSTRIQPLIVDEPIDQGDDTNKIGDFNPENRPSDGPAMPLMGLHVPAPSDPFPINDLIMENQDGNFGDMDLFLSDDWINSINLDDIDLSNC